MILTKKSKDIFFLILRPYQYIFVHLCVLGTLHTYNISLELNINIVYLFFLLVGKLHSFCLITDLQRCRQTVILDPLTTLNIRCSMP